MGDQNSGEFSEWLHCAEASLLSGKGATNVPCGTCTACCRSSMFIHIRPDETKTLRRISRALLFPAPGWPEGHVLMGYNDRGHCPMLVDERCSIYEDRPQTCRSYDCRVFAATGVAVELETQADIAERVRAWEFDYESDASRREQAMLRDAAAFLRKNRDLFPAGSIPKQPAQLAALAVLIYRVFSEHRAAGSADAAIARSILAVLEELGR
jgi:Fe-S-cluster containining protein